MSTEEAKAWETYEDVANYPLEKLSETLGPSRNTRASTSFA